MCCVVWLSSQPLKHPHMYICNIHVHAYTYSNTHTLKPTHTLTHTNSLTHSLKPTHSNSLTQTHSHSHAHTHTLTQTHSLKLTHELKPTHTHIHSTLHTQHFSYNDISWDGEVIVIMNDVRLSPPYSEADCVGTGSSNLVTKIMKQVYNIITHICRLCYHILCQH